MNNSSSYFDPAVDARKWADSRFAAARKVPVTEEYLRFPDQPAANWHVNVSLKPTKVAQQELYELGQDIARRSGVAGLVPVPRQSIHISLLWGRHLSPTPHGDQTVAVEGNWTRRDARAVAAAMANVFADAKPFSVRYDDVIALSKQVFAIPRGANWPSVFELANTIRENVDALKGAGYAEAKSPLEGGPIVQSSLLLFPPGLPMQPIIDAVEERRHDGTQPVAIETLVSEVVLSVHEHRKLDFPDPTSQHRVGIRQTGYPIGTYEVGGRSVVEGVGR